MQLRDYQIYANEVIAAELPKYTQPLIISATGGAGKSLMIAQASEIILKINPLARILCLADRKELLEQNENKFNDNSIVGVVSAGLNRYEYGKIITIGGIQTVYNKAELLGLVDYILIDEVDLYNGKSGMYHNLIKKYPDAKIIGFTGTPWRTNEGQLTWGKIIYHITYKQLLEQGYLSPVVSQVRAHVDKSNWQIKNGEYTAETIQQEYINKNSIGAWVGKLKVYGQDRKHWLVFMPTVESARDMTFGLATIGVVARCITGSTPAIEREQIIREFKNGEIQAIVGVGVFERGFDAPLVDFIADFNPTKSLKKWLQRIWRGVRLAEGKLNCAYADFAGNIREFGSINNIDIGVSETGKLTVKRKIVEEICPTCETSTPVSSKKCVHCDYEFLVEKVEKRAYLDAESKWDINAEVKKQKLDHAWCVVSKAEYHVGYKSKTGSVTPIMAIYTIGTGRKIYNAVWHNDKIRWLGLHGHVFGKIEVEKLKVPNKIQVDFTKKFPLVVNYEF